MELLYIWIKKYRGLKEIGLNLSNQYRFQYDEKHNKLNVKSTENFIPKFFGENISNFTGIIGENGAGKTSALKYIIEYCSGGIHNNEDKQAIVIFKNKDKILYYSHLDFEINLPKGFDPYTKIDDLEILKSATTTIFLSNTFDPTSYYTTDYSKQQFGDTKNLSTWHLLYYDYQNRTGDIAFNPKLTYDDKISAFASQEFMRMVKLITWLNLKEQKGRLFPVKPPPYLNLSLYFNINQQYKDKLSVLTKTLNSYFEQKKSKKNKFLLRAFLAAIYHFINEIKFISGSDEIKDSYKKLPDQILKYIEKQKSEMVTSENSIIPELHSIFNYLVSNSEFDIINERITQMQSFLDQLGEFVNTRNIILHENGSIVSIEITKANKLALGELINEYYQLDQISGYAEFYFSHQPAGESSLSSGEYAMLSVFARLNSIKIEKNKSILMLIDEAELALHPQWQKEFIYHFTEFITEKFQNNKVQVIITSHSPFILSDLPPNCVILLKKWNNSSIVVDGLDKKNETFGANIHELFTDSFFLQNGLIGEFARRKIENLIIRINSKEKYTHREYKSLKKEINIIGEPYVRFKILEKLLIGLPRDIFDEVLVEKEKELELIRKIRNDKN
jgi:hypothetical protein